MVKEELIEETGSDEKLNLVVGVFLWVFHY